MKFKVRCPHCNQVFVVSAPSEAAAPPPRAPAPPPPATPHPPPPPSPPPPRQAAPALEEERELTPEEEKFREEIVQSILARRLQLPMLPHVALKVIRLASDPNASMQEMAKVILTDQTIAAKILQIANSAVYASPTEIKNINQALVRLGQVEVKNLMLAISLQTRIFKSRLYGRLARVFWERSVGTAFAARVVASGLRGDKDEAFLCGLMHNLGRMIALTVMEEAQKKVGPDFRPLAGLIRQIAEQYHRDVGGLTVEKWSLPPAVGETIRFYERPQEQQEPGRIAPTINFAEGFCRRLGIGAEAPEDLRLADLPGARLLRVEADAAEELFARFAQVYEQAKGEFL